VLPAIESANFSIRPLMDHQRGSASRELVRSGFMMWRRHAMLGCVLLYQTL
jgi:hypothetical protein